MASKADLGYGERPRLRRDQLRPPVVRAVLAFETVIDRSHCLSALNRYEVRFDPSTPAAKESFGKPGKENAPVPNKPGYSSKRAFSSASNASTGRGNASRSPQSPAIRAP
jgi:hypothetical protein